MKLKTLKHIGVDYVVKGYGYYSAKTLRQEAIKHIKALRNGDCDIEGINDWISVILYLKYLFNIIDEDLK